MKKFLKDNLLIWIYIIIVTLIELIGVFVTSGKFYIRSPWLFILLQSIFVGILFLISNNRARHCLASIFLILFAIVNIVFIVIFEMTETIFDYGMFNLRNDGMAILESIPINFTFFSLTMIMITAFIVFGARYVRHNNKNVKFRFSKVIVPIFLVVVLGLNCTVLYFNNRNFQEDVQAKLYRASEASYCELGMTANFVNEVFKGKFFSKVKLGDQQELEDYIYDEIVYSNFERNFTKNYNVVSILVESFEWHSFVQDFSLFVNGHNINYSNYINPEINQPYNDANEILQVLFPNIYHFYNNGVALTNFYSREKTDISENLSFLGAYPTNAYINYDFPDNTMSSSLPNILKTLDNDISCKAFHNGSYTYYNRNKALISAGFDSYIAGDQMYKVGMRNWASKGERNLDYDMIVSCSEHYDMFPTDKRFYTEITSITMHGQYAYRKNLEERGYYDKMAEFGIKTMGGGSVQAFNHNNFYYYCACVMEFDKALGEIQRQLEKEDINGTKLKDNTIILLFGDHNTYYSSLSNYVKGIDDVKNKNYTNLFRVPCLIQYPNMEQLKNYLTIQKSHSTILIDDSIENAQELIEQSNANYVINLKNGNNQILVRKFSSTADIMPTLLDLLGINYFGNLCFGHSIFSDTTSVLYSRAYDMFITDSLYFSSLNKIKYIRKDQPILNNDPALKYANLASYDSEDHITEVEEECKLLLHKLDTCNRIFYNDYFARKNVFDKTKTNDEIFKTKIAMINM